MIHVRIKSKDLPNEWLIRVCLKTASDTSRLLFPWEKATNLWRIFQSILHPAMNNMPHHLFYILQLTSHPPFGMFLWDLAAALKGSTSIGELQDSVDTSRRPRGWPTSGWSPSCRVVPSGWWTRRKPEEPRGRQQEMDSFVVVFENGKIPDTHEFGKMFGLYKWSNEATPILGNLQIYQPGPDWIFRTKTQLGNQAPLGITIPSQRLYPISQMEVSWNRGTPKSSILMWFSLINPPFWGTPIYGNPQITECGAKSLIFHQADDLNPALNSAQGADFGEPIQLGRRWQRSAFRVGAPGISTGSPAGTSGGSYPPVVKHGNG